MIVNKLKKKPTKIEIDLTGPQGNAFVVMSVAKDLAKQLSLDWKPIQDKMMSGDYENLLRVMEEYFGEYIIMYR